MKNLDLIAKITAGLSFVFGTLIFVSFLYIKNNIIPIGIFFVLASIIINSLVFITLFIGAMYYEEDRIEYLKTCALMLLNIPIALLYFFLVINLENGI